MRVLGLTGGIGSGKSTVADMLRSLGAAVVDADRLAREVVAPGTAGLEAVRARFGDEVLDPSGALDRRALARVVFSSPEARRALEGIIHPRVAALAAQRLRAAEAAGAELAVYDVPLLYENGLDRDLPEVAVVWASLPTRRARLSRREGWSDEEIDARLAAQIPLEDKVARARHVVDNDGDLASTRASVERLHRALVPPRAVPHAETLSHEQ